MQANARVFVVIPAYCEEERITTTLRGIPGRVSGIVVIDDASPDRTGSRAREVQDPRITVVRHDRNRGVGAAIASGYRRALELGADILVVMAGDAQMDPSDLPALLEPLERGEADYVKGNRFLHADVGAMPRHRRWGSHALGLLTAELSGLHLDDSQCGYTALAASAARSLDLEGLWPGYGYPNDLLIQLGRRGFRVAEVAVRPVYAGERSGLRPWHLLTILGVIARRTLKELDAGRRAATALADPNS